MAYPRIRWFLAVVALASVVTADARRAGAAGALRHSAYVLIDTPLSPDLAAELPVSARAPVRAKPGVCEREATALVGRRPATLAGKVVRVWTIREVQITPPLPAFNKAIVDAFRQWQFEPLKIDNEGFGDEGSTMRD